MATHTKLLTQCALYIKKCKGETVQLRLPVNTDGTKGAELAVPLLVPAATVLVVINGGLQEMLGLKEVHFGAATTSTVTDIEVGGEGHDQTLRLIDLGQLALNTCVWGGGRVWCRMKVQLVCMTAI